MQSVPCILRIPTIVQKFCNRFYFIPADDVFHKYVGTLISGQPIHFSPIPNFTTNVFTNGCITYCLLLSVVLEPLFDWNVNTLKKRLFKN